MLSTLQSPVSEIVTIRNNSHNTSDHNTDEIEVSEIANITPPLSPPPRISQTPETSQTSETSKTSSRPSRACVLCQYHGNTAVVTKRIVTYMEDAVSNVHRDEICQQVSEELQNYDFDVTPDDVRVHMEQHMINKHVILSTVVSDLMGIARASKQSCMLTSDETGQPAIDPKYASIYFKAVDQLTSILRSDAFKTRSVGPGSAL